MRITGGIYKGRLLKVPSGIRPTSDRVKEAIFNILGPIDEQASVLDLYAGSGALGIEALSRGAVEATFVDQSRLSSDVIKRNLKDLGLTGFVERQDVRTFLKSSTAKFDLIFIDPPYAKFEESIMSDIGGHIKKSGIIVLETSKRVKDPSLALRMTDWSFDERSYGDTLVRLFRCG